MAVIHPFRALRPAPGTAAAVSSVPYDVVSTEEARELADGNPLSFLHVTRSEIDLPPAPIRIPTGVRQARENFDALREARRSSSRTAVALLLPAADGAHEQTGDRRLLLRRRIRAGRHHEARAHAPRQGGRSHAAHDRAARADRRRVPDLHGAPDIDRSCGSRRRCTTSRRPTASTTRSGGGLDRPAAGRRRSRDSGAVYIADGHHRAASAARARAELSDGRQRRGDASTFIAVAFPDNQMQILPYNRS